MEERKAIQNRVVIVTGGSKGYGAGVALVLEYTVLPTVQEIMPL